MEALTLLLFVNFVFSQKYLIDTPGCQIGNYFMPIPDEKTNISCGDRKIFAIKTNDNRISFHFTEDIKNCCFKYIYNPIYNGSMNEEEVEYSSCSSITNGSKIRLVRDFIHVSCQDYEDAFGFTTKIDKISVKKKGSWNVIALGLDRTSRMRAYYSLGDTVNYLVKNDWLDFRGYNKLGHNTYPNIAPVLTGKNRTELDEACSPDMTACNHLMIWNKFKEAGYVTAYGEDFLDLPDTLHRNNYFKLKPTDHYMRPLFTATERKTEGTMCSGEIPSGEQILSYVLDFVETYKKHKMFGFFWISSFGHNTDQSLNNFDTTLKSFLRKLSKLDDTFLIFFSDHGLRYGTQKRYVESYYEDRLPMLFIKVPKDFRTAHLEMYRNLKQNQGRLISPFDLHLTLKNMLNFTESPTSFPMVSNCPNCHSMFLPISKYRTCEDAGIPIEFCTCYKLNPTSLKNYDAMYSLIQLVTRVQNYAKKVATQRCKNCAPLSFHELTRMHYFTANNDKFFVIAFTMLPSFVGFEGIVQKDINFEYRIINPITSITVWKDIGECAIELYDRQYCVCENSLNCEINLQSELKHLILRTLLDLQNNVALRTKQILQRATKLHHV